jgi:hypothetical protein
LMFETKFEQKVDSLPRIRTVLALLKLRSHLQQLAISRQYVNH